MFEYFVVDRRMSLELLHRSPDKPANVEPADYRADDSLLMVPRAKRASSLREQNLVRQLRLASSREALFLILAAGQFGEEGIGQESVLTIRALILYNMSPGPRVKPRSGGNISRKDIERSVYSSE